MKRKTNIQIGLCLFAILFAFNINAEFADVDVTHPNFHAIDSLESSNIVKGYSRGNQRFYKPLDPIIRAEVLKVLMLAADIDITDNGVDYFADVPSQEWYAPFVNTAADLEIVHGFADGDFHPAAQVSRAEFLKMLALSFDMDAEEEQEGEDWYERFYRVTTLFRILENENASPHESVSRGEVAEMIYRAQKVAASDFTKRYIYSGSGSASYYNEGFAGKSTANGETYDPMDMTAAHRTLPFGTFVKVSHDDKFVIVRINDRGPYHKQRIIDLSQKAFERLAPISRGVINVEFEVVSSNGEQSEVPLDLQEYLVTETRNETLPESVSEKVSVLRSSDLKKKRTTLPLFNETVTHLAPEFFPNALLRRTIPQTITEGTIFQLAGTAKDAGYQKATVFLQRVSDSEGLVGDQIHFSGPVSGRNFSFPMKFLIPGRYHVGLVFDEGLKSRVEEIEVVPMPKDRIFPSSSTQFFTDLDVRVIPESSQVKLSWESDATLVSKIVFTQQNKKETLVLEDGIGELLLDIAYFEKFQPQEAMTMTLYQALSNNGTFEQQTTNWKRATTKTFQLVEAFPDSESDKISVSEFPRFPDSLDAIVLEGKLLSVDVSLPDHAYVMTPSGAVKQVLLDKRGIDAFRFRMIPEEWGTHILEFVSSEGEVLFNRALYVSSQYVLPIIPWKSVSLASESVGSVRTWTNALRAEQHANPVFADGNLNRFAQSYAEQMAYGNFISHTTPTGMTLDMRMMQAGLQGDFGENLSFGTNLNIALTGLENSSSHRRNMLLQKWTKVGIGMAKNTKGEIYVVQVFGK